MSAASYFLRLTPYAYALRLTAYASLLTSYFLLLTSYFLLLTSYFLQAEGDERGTAQLRALFNSLDADGSGVIDYRKFSELVMGSKRGDGTSAQHNNPSLSLGTDDAGTSDQMIRRKIRDQIKTIVIGFKHADLGKSGYISEAALLQVLSNHGVDLSALRLRELQTKVKKEVVSALRLHALCIARLCRG